MPDTSSKEHNAKYFGYLLCFLAFGGFATILICCSRLLIHLYDRLCYGTHIQSQSNDQQININARHHGVDSRPYELPIIDPVATVQDHQDQHRLQVNLRPYHTHHNPIMEFIAPSAPRLDLEDLPPSYEEAVKMTMSTQV